MLTTLFCGGEGQLLHFALYCFLFTCDIPLSPTVILDKVKKMGGIVVALDDRSNLSYYNYHENTN